jgi:hypothetical protein
MRRYTAAVAALLLFVTACTDDEVDVAPAATGVAPVETEPAVDEGPPVEELLDEYGALLAAAAVTGGDALERTLTVTAADGYDRACAPGWAHALLDEAGEEPAAVEVVDDGVRVGGVDVPVDASSGRALHLGGDCEDRLPQPDRSRPEPEPDPEPAPQQAAPQLASPPSTPETPAQQPAAPQPEPRQVAPVAPSREAPARVVPPVTGEEDGREYSAQELARRFGDAVWRVMADGCGGRSSGTAFAVGKRTLITNGHVVNTDMAPRLVSRDGGEVLQGQVLGWSVRPDVAVIRVESDLETRLAWAATDGLEEGQQLVALGYPVPAGDFTVTRADILSFQTAGAKREAIRTDGALDQGNSGGPVLTSRGKVAGVVTEMAVSPGFQTVPLSYTHDHLSATIDELTQDSGAQADCSAFRGPRW